MDLTPGFPVLPSRLVPDGRTVTRSTPLGVVTLLGVEGHEAVATVIVRSGLAAVLAWLTDPPDLRTGAETLSSLRASLVDQGPPVVQSDAVVGRLAVREEGPCAWCSAWTVRYRPVGRTMAPLFCKPSHASALARVPAQDTRRREREAAAAAALVAAEEARKARCPRPDKIAYPSRRAAHVAWEETIKNGYRGTLSIYQCACGSHHLGNAGKTLNARINTVKNVKIARRRSGR